MRLFALVHPRFAAAFLYAAYAGGAAYAAGCPWLPTSIVSWHSPLQYYTVFLFMVSCLYSPPLLLKHCYLQRSTPQKKMEGASLGILSGSSSGAHSFSSPLLYFSTPPHGLSSFTSQYLPTSPYLLFKTPCPGLSTGTSSLLF